jgi:hypothetical protein
MMACLLTAERRVSAGKKLTSLTLESGIFVDFNPDDNTWKY